MRLLRTLFIYALYSLVFASFAVDTNLCLYSFAEITGAYCAWPSFNGILLVSFAIDHRPSRLYLHSFYSLLQHVHTRYTHATHSRLLSYPQESTQRLFCNQNNLYFCKHEGIHDFTSCLCLSGTGQPVWIDCASIYRWSLPKRVHVCLHFTQRELSLALCS